MGDMTRAEIILQVRQDLDGRSVVDLPDARVGVWLDATLNHVTNPKVYMHPRLYVTENVTLVTGTNEYVLGNAGTREVWLVIGVRNSTANQEYPLYPKGRKYFRRLQQSPQGRPSYYAHISDPTNLSILKVYNTPAIEYNGQILEVEEYCKHLTWTTDHVLDAMWDEVLIAGGVWRGWKSLNQPVFQDRALSDYAALINEIREREGLEIIEDPRSFDVDPGGFGSPRYAQYGRF
jgi:hypothetical protein